MGINDDILIIQIALLTSITLLGIPGNIVAIAINVTKFRRNTLNAFTYLHLAVVDLLLCTVHASLGLLLDLATIAGFYSEYTQAFDFIRKQLRIRFFMVATPLSALALGIIAALRCWRVFNPFKQPRKKLLISLVLALDLLVIGSVLGTSSSFTFPSNRTSHHRHLDQLQTAANLTNYRYNRSLFLMFKGSSNVSAELSETGDRSGNVCKTINFFNNTDYVMSENVSTDVKGWMLNDGTQFVSELTNATFMECSRTTLRFRPKSSKITAAVVVTVSVTITVSYVLICVKLRKEFKSLIPSLTQKRDFLRRQTKQVITHFILVLIALVTMWPAFLATSSSFPKIPVLKQFDLTITVLQSAINPYIYCLLLKDNREKLRALCCRCQGNKKIPSKGTELVFNKTPCCTPLNS